MTREERLLADGFFADTVPTLFYRASTLGSNFSPHHVTLTDPWTGEERNYKTCEHRYQAMKADNQYEHDWICRASTAFESKQRGRACSLREPWGEKYGTFAYYVMLETVMAKAWQYKEVRDWLKASVGTPIYEDSPTDDIWGWRYRDNYRGRNLLGRCWMEVRVLLNA